MRHEWFNNITKAFGILHSKKCRQRSHLKACTLNRTGVEHTENIVEGLMRSVGRPSKVSEPYLWGPQMPADEVSNWTSLIGRKLTQNWCFPTIWQRLMIAKTKLTYGLQGWQKSNQVLRVLVQLCEPESVSQWRWNEHLFAVPLSETFHPNSLTTYRFPTRFERF